MKTTSSIEPLEARIAPALLNPAGNLLTYTDVDGDFVKVTFTHAVMKAADFSNGFVDGEDTTPQALSGVNLMGKTGAGFTLVATPQKIGGEFRGDSHANINTITAADPFGGATNLGTISVDGDVARISAGTGEPGTVGLKSFTALSMGRGDIYLLSVLQNVQNFTVKDDVENVDLAFTGGLKSLHIGGNLAEDRAEANVKITGEVGTVSIGGSIIDLSSGRPSLVIQDGTVPGTVKIGGSIIGGSADISTAYQVSISQPLKSFTVGHDVRGGSGYGSGAIRLATVGTVKIGGSLLGHDDASASGYVLVLGTVGSFTIGGDLRGGKISGDDEYLNGTVVVVGNVGTFKLGGDLAAGTQTGAGTFTQSNCINIDGTVGTLTVGGSVYGTLGSGSGGATAAVIMAGAFGTTGAVNAIKSLSVKGSVERASIFTGYVNTSSGFAAGNGDSGIGSIIIGGSLSGTQIDVGTSVGADGIPGTADDGIFYHGPNDPSLATLGSVKVGGAINGLLVDATTYYIYGPHVKKVTVGKATYGVAALQNGVTFNAVGKASAVSVF